MNKKLWQRQMSLGEVLGEGFRLLQMNLIPFSLLVICTHAPLNLLRTFLSSIIPVEKYGVTNVSLVVSGIKWIDSFLGLIVFIGIAYILEKSLQGQIISFGDVFKFSFSRLSDVFWTSLLLSVIVLGLTLLLIIPGVIWSNNYSFTLAIVALRNLKGRAALEASKKLIYGQWWRVFGIYTAIAIPALVITFPILMLSRKVSDIKFLYIFAPLTIFNIVGAITTVMAIVLFLNTEYARDFQRQKHG